MQPTHATSDCKWVVERLGKERLDFAYALKTCMQKSGMIALGTDFPVEEVNPFYTFYAATMRAHPLTGISFDWLIEQRLTPYQALQGMTIWAAYAQFEEMEKGSIEIGKYGDFVVMNYNLMNPDAEVAEQMPEAVYINGVLVEKPTQ